MARDLDHIRESFGGVLEGLRQRFPGLWRNEGFVRLTETEQIRRRGGDPLRAVRLGCSARDAGEFGAAAVLFEWVDVVAMNKRRPSLYLNMAVLDYVRAGDLDDAHRCATLALAKATDYPVERVRALADYAVVLGAKGDLEGARSYCRQAEALMATRGDEELHYASDSLARWVGETRARLGI